MISQQYHSINSVIITTATNMPAITPAIRPIFTGSLLLDTLCCVGVVGLVTVAGEVGLVIVVGNVELVGLSEGDDVCSLFLVTSCTYEAEQLTAVTYLYRNTFTIVGYITLIILPLNFLASGFSIPK